MLAATKKGNLRAKAVCGQCSLEIAGSVGDTPIHDLLPTLGERRTCQSLVIPSIGLDELG